MFRESALRDGAQLDVLLRWALHTSYDRNPAPGAWAALAARLAAPLPPNIPRSTNAAYPGLLFIPELLLAG